jgi:hypothetical protein
MNECEELPAYISSYQDTLIFNLRPTVFAIRFRRLAFGWRQDVAHKVAETPE